MSLSPSPATHLNPRDLIFPYYVLLPYYKVLLPYLKIAIRGDGKSPDQKVIDMQLQAANLVYIFNNVVLWML